MKKQNASPCDTCALRDGSITNTNEPHNRLRAMICVEAALPFYCHYSGAGDWSDIGISKLNQAESMTMRRELPICQNWKAQVAAKAKTGFYDKATRQIRRWAGIFALQQINRFIEAEPGAIKDHALKQIEQVLAMLKGGRAKAR